MMKHAIRMTIYATISSIGTNSNFLNSIYILDRRNKTKTVIKMRFAKKFNAVFVFVFGLKRK